MDQNKYLLLFVIILFLSCQEDKEEFAISLSWELVKNYESDGSYAHDASFTLTNNGRTELTDSNWSLYWSQAPHDINTHTSSDQISVRRINGDFYEMMPEGGFTLPSGEQIEVTLSCDGHIIKESDGPLGVYVVKEDSSFYIVDDVKIKPFVRPEQVNRTSDDQEPVASAEALFAASKDLQAISKEELYPIIPHPKSVIKGVSNYAIPSGLRVFYKAPIKKELEYLSEELNTSIQQVYFDSLAELKLLVDDKITNPEGYKLDIAADGITLTASTKKGMFYGIVSLVSLYDQGSRTVPIMTIEDEPAYSYRGMHVDVARNFQSKETILRLIDVMASLKLNKLLLYITEDEGWRLSIEELPELTRVSGSRGHTLTDEKFLQPSYGSGPKRFNPKSNGNGFYTRTDFKEIIRYAYEKHIDIIPEVNLPGHARAAIYAMENRYRRLMSEGKEKEAQQYRLIDPDDQSVYQSAQSYNDNIACVCRPSIYDFYEVVLSDIQEMYEEAKVPLTMIHTGGDEVPKGAWTESPICKEYLKQYPEITNIRNLQSHFFGNLVKRLAKTGLQIGGWEEVVMDFDDNNHWQINDQFVGDNVYPYIWNNLWGEEDLGYRIANVGYPVILCNVSNFYFDLAYDKDPREPGLYWAGFINEKDAFSFVPENMFLSTTSDDMGHQFHPEIDFKDKERLKKSAKQNIIGLQGQLWGETVKGRDMLEYYYLPKIYGLAHRAWEGNPQWSTLANTEQREEAIHTDYERFINTITQREFKRLDAPDKKYHYRIPAPGLMKQGDQVLINAPYPGMTIRYTTDGSEPNAKSTIYTEPIITDVEQIRAKVFNSIGRSGYENKINVKTKSDVE